jgi:CHAT domain-containing protein/Tfp pilus assembly protein PilF
VALCAFLSACNGSAAGRLESCYSDALSDFRRGYLPRALQRAQEGFESSHNQLLWQWKFRILEAEILIRQRSPEKAVAMLEPQPPPDLPAELYIQRELQRAQAFCWMKKPAETELYLHEAEKLGALTIPASYADHEFSKGICAFINNDPQAAEKSFRAALDRAGAKDQSFAANVIGNLGLLAVKKERYDEAIDWFTRALRILRELKAAPIEQRTLGNIGWSHFQLGEFSLAADMLAQAADQAARLGLKNDEQQWSLDLGVMNYVEQKYSDAERYYLKSLALAKDQGLKDATVLALHNLSQLCLKRGQVDKADEYNKESYAAAGLGPADQSDPYLLLTSAEIAEARGHHQDAEGLLNAVINHPAADSSLRWQAQSDLANLYVAENEIAKADEMFDHALHTVEEARDRTTQEDRRMSILDAWPFYDDYIRFLVNHDKAVKALQIAEFSRGRALAEAFEISQAQKPARLQISSAQSFLRMRNQVILAYWISEQESYLWALNGRQFQLFLLPDKQKINAEIDAYNREIRGHADTQGSAHGQKLYEMLVKPAEKFLPLNAKVIIVPNRSLYKLNFESLVVPGKSPHYWIEDAVLENASSIALLAEAKRRPPPGSKKLLLIGAPVEATDDFPTLRFAGEEIKSVERHFSREQETIVAGKEATPSAYRAAHPENYQFIHLVTHGTASQISPLDSAIILSMDQDKSFKLYARNIKDIRPLRADLVTISACYGLGEKTYSGEGLVGLAWAFMRAGSHQVIAALWDVDDAVMPKLMDDFYSELDHHKTAAEALRFAKLAVLRSKDFHRKPYYWASLQLYTGS